MILSLIGYSFCAAPPSSPDFFFLTGHFLPHIFFISLLPQRIYFLLKNNIKGKGKEALISFSSSRTVAILLLSCSFYFTVASQALLHFSSVSSSHPSCTCNSLRSALPAPEFRAPSTPSLEIWQITQYTVAGIRCLLGYEEGKLVQSAEAAYGRKLVLLQDWWLVKAGPDSHGKRLGIGGFTLKGNQGIRCFSSAPIVKRHDAVTLQTDDGIALMVHGYLNRSRTLENGFSEEVCDHFLIGFPYYWEDFAAMSDSEEQVYSCASPSDAYKTPAQEASGSNLMSGNTNDAILTEASSAKKKKTRVQTQSMDSAGGPLTRSKARLLATRK